MKKMILKLTVVIAGIMMVVVAKAQTDSTQIDSTLWYNQTQQLGEVVVKSKLPKTRVKGDAMRTTIVGSILEKAGTLSDMLKKIPSLKTERDGAVEVLGRGEAEVYINGRKVLDIRELSRLRSDQILHVDVVQNPGARYSASTKAVVRIQLKKAQGEGISFQDYVSGMYQYGHTITNNLDVNYRTGGLDITGSFWAGRYGHSKSLQRNDLTYYVGPDCYQGFSHQETKKIWKGLSPQIQVNYMVNENHSFGAFYKYDYHPNGEANSMFYTDNYENGKYTESSISKIWSDDNFRKHIFNAYYNGKVGKLGIDLNIDGLFDNTETPSKTDETTMVPTNIPQLGENTVAQNPTLQSEGSEGKLRSINSNTKSANNFIASKLILSYPVWKGNFSVGGEYSYNHRTDAYSFLANETVPVKATDTKINESSTAAFMEYGRSFGKVFVQAGLRYEYLTNDYYNFGEREGEMCRNYGDWFPTLVVSAPVGKAQLSLSYRRDIQRPNYANLTSSTVYINRYTYQSGNPYLKPTYTHSIVFNAAYKWTNLTVNYARIKDSETMATEPFPGSDDPLISLVRPINSSKDYNQLSVIASARPVIGIWHPTWTIVVFMQDYKTPCAAGTIKTLNHTRLNMGWDNDIELPHGFRLNASVYCNTKGDYNNFRITRTLLYTNIGLQRDFSLHRMGSLTFDLRCADPLNCAKSEGRIYGMREITTSNPARSTFMLDITWKFNEARSKYRGSGAGDKQKARM